MSSAHSPSSVSHRASASPTGVGPSSSEMTSHSTISRSSNRSRHAPDVLERPLRGLGARRRHSARGSEPGPSDAMRARGRARPRTREDARSTAWRLRGAPPGSPRLGEQAEEPALDQRAGGQWPVARRRRGLDRLRQHAIGPASGRGSSPWTTRTFGTSSTRSGSSGGSSATAREIRFTPAGPSLADERAPSGAAKPLGRLARERARCVVHRRRARSDSGTPVRGGSRPPPRTRSPARPRRARASGRIARAARPAPPSGSRRTRRRESAGGGSGRSARRGSARSGRISSLRTSDAERRVDGLAAAPPAPARRRLPRRRPCRRPRPARSPLARPPSS